MGQPSSSKLTHFSCDAVLCHPREILVDVISVLPWQHRLNAVLGDRLIEETVGLVVQPLLDRSTYRDVMSPLTIITRTLPVRETPFCCCTARSLTSRAELEVRQTARTESVLTVRQMC